MCRRCLVLLATVLAMVVLSFSARGFTHPGIAYASSYTAALATNSQGISLGSTHTDACGTVIGLGIVNATIRSSILGVPTSPIDPASLAGLQGCVP